MNKMKVMKDSAALNAQKGFSWIEVIIVLVVLSTLFTIATNYYLKNYYLKHSEPQNKQQVKAPVSFIQSQLNSKHKGS